MQRALGQTRCSGSENNYFGVIGRQMLFKMGFIQRGLRLEPGRIKTGQIGKSRSNFRQKLVHEVVVDQEPTLASDNLKSHSLRIVGLPVHRNGNDTGHDASQSKGQVHHIISAK